MQARIIAVQILNLRFLNKVEYSSKPLILPSIIEEDVLGITRAISKKAGLSKFLFYGAPGSGKTETVFQIARILNRDILSVPFEQLVDSRLGETAKNVSMLFEEINHLAAFDIRWKGSCQHYCLPIGNVEFIRQACIILCPVIGHFPILQFYVSKISRWRSLLVMRIIYIERSSKAY